MRVDVEPHFHPEYSDPTTAQWFFSYAVRITNLGAEPVQLVSRHWFITHANGKVDEVRGPGVVGEQPRLGPGEHFEYTSFCQLETDMGAMHGTYQMLTDDGDAFDAEIAPFTLADPDTLN